MLERAVKSINHGGCRRYAPAQHLLPSCRRLHSAFWRHGAGDLDHLPASCFSPFSTLFEPLRNMGLDSRTSTPVQHQNASPVFVLIFPENTKHLIRRLSLSSLRQWRIKLRRWNSANTLRAFVSSANGRPSEASPVDSRPSDALKQLQEYIVAYKRGHYQESWSAALQLFDSLDPSEKTEGLIHGLVQLLASSPRSSDRQHAVHLFEQIPVQDRQPEVYSTVIRTLLSFRQLSKAITMSEQALESHINPTIAGIDALLTHFITQRQWQLLFRMWSRCVDSFEDSQFLAQWKETLFKRICSLPRYHARIASLLYAIGDFPNSISPEADKPLVVSLVGSVFRHGSHFGPRQNRRIISIMNELRLAEPYMFDSAMLRTLEDRKVPLYTRVAHAFEIYKDGLGDSSSGAPGRRVMRTLLDAASQVWNRDVVLHLFDDWHRLFGPPDLAVAGLFMKCFAAFGDADKVDQILQTFIAEHGKPPLRLYYPVLHVRALKAEPDAVREQMALMQSETGHSPDVVCWNILMHAYQRDDDLEGAMRCMSETLEAGVAPDSYTIGTLMAAGADRGDLNLVERLLKSADSLKIRRTPIMNDCMVLALLNNHRWKSAEKFAVSATRESQRRHCTRMWNQILSYHSLQRPPVNLPRVLRVARTIREELVPFNSWTFSAMMRAFIVRRQTDLARRILRKVILRKSIHVQAFHYALIMDGYANEMAFEKGIRMHAEMLGRGIEPDVSIKLALLKLHARAARNKILVDEARRPGVRVDVSEELFEELIEPSELKAHTGKTPWMGASRFSVLDAHPALYFEFLISLYGKSRAFHIVKSLLTRYEENIEQHHAERRSRFPFRFLSTIMNIKYRQSAYEEVKQCWTLARQLALKLSKTSGQINQSQAQPWLAPVRRTLLARHLDIYLRSLDAQLAQDKMRQEINELLSLGFDLDNRNWNLYIQLLATRQLYIEAFSLCETHLMGSFTGWGSANKPVSYAKATQKRAPGLEYRGFGQAFYFLRHGQLEVEYATIVRLAREYVELRRAAPFDRTKQELLKEIDSKAPMTTRAMRDMPRIANPIARHILGVKRTIKWRRAIGKKKPKVETGSRLRRRTKTN